MELRGLKLCALLLLGGCSQQFIPNTDVEDSERLEQKSRSSLEEVVSTEQAVAQTLN